MKHFTQVEADRLIAEYFDDTKVVLLCSKHQYMPGGAKEPTPRCEECAQLFWRHMLAKTPPHLRAEKLERLNELVHKLIEHEQELSQVKLFRHPEVTFEKN